jgi:hypothetical protein
MTEPANPAYAAPRAPLEGAAETNAGFVARATECRIAGAFLVTGALVSVLPWAWRVRASSSTLRGIPMSMYLTMFLPGVVGPLVALALAVPLLRGSRRFRALTIGFQALRVGLAAGYGLFTFLFVRGPFHLPATNAVPSVVFALLGLAAFVLLLTGPPSRGRMTLALVAIAVHVVSWAAALLG